jgi:N-acetyl-anhydromuramyl-L-alanine amidase AmpD
MFLAAAGLGLVQGCVGPGEPLKRQGDEIVVAGRLFHIQTDVVLWLDPKGYDAYAARRHFDPTKTQPSNAVSPNDAQRYGTRRNLAGHVASQIDDQGWSLENLQQIVDQFVIHYDVCGTSAQCFYILQDVRGLSVHFMLDIDGTIYQTLDLKERAWHAGTANDRSVGIEIANIGAYRDMKVLDTWYQHDDDGWPYITLPEKMSHPEIRTAGFVGRPARKDVVTGEINGRELMQYDFTDEQYEALIKLTAGLARIFPKLTLTVPRDENGAVRSTALSDEEREAYSGLMGHWHVTTGKADPGPAFDWTRVLGGAQKALRGLGV